MIIDCKLSSIDDRLDGKRRAWVGVGFNINEYLARDGKLNRSSGISEIRAGMVFKTKGK